MYLIYTKAYEKLVYSICSLIKFVHNFDFKGLLKGFKIQSCYGLRYEVIHLKKVSDDTITVSLSCVTNCVTLTNLMGA